MTTHKTCGRRRLTVLLCVLLLFCTALAPPAFAAGVTVSTTSATAYFQTYASSGTWVDIGTPQHMINETGNVCKAYPVPVECFRPWPDAVYRHGLR